MNRVPQSNDNLFLNLLHSLISSFAMSYESVIYSVKIDENSNIQIRKKSKKKLVKKSQLKSAIVISARIF